MKRVMNRAKTQFTLLYAFFEARYNLHRFAVALGATRTESLSARLPEGNRETAQEL